MYAACFLHLKQPRYAITDSLQVISRKPDWAKGYFRAGSALQAAGLHASAAYMLHVALAIEPGNKTVTQVLAASEKHLTHPVSKGSSMIHTWGGNSQGSCGHGDTKERNLPKHLVGKMAGSGMGHRMCTDKRCCFSVPLLLPLRVPCQYVRYLANTHPMLAWINMRAYVGAGVYAWPACVGCFLWYGSHSSSAHEWTCLRM